MGSDARVGRVALTAAAIDAALLISSGVWLVFRYHPTNPFAPATDPVRVVHAITAYGLVLAFAVAFVLAVVRAAREVTGRVVALIAALVGTVVAAAGVITGRLLPWDQVALWAVTLGTNMSGYGSLWGDEARFYLAQGREVSVEQMQTMFVVHVVVLPLVLVGLVAAVVLARRRHAPVRDVETQLVS